MNRREALKGTALIFGYALTGSTVATIMQSCGTESNLSWTPQVLNESQANTLSALVDRILPATETPGAIEVGVDQFIDKILHRVFPDNIQEGYASGLDEFNQYAKSQFNKNFTRLTHAEQDQIITAYEEKSGRMPNSIWDFTYKNSDDFPFYSMTKELALIGYFHSERISKEVLSYNPIPGPFIGCIPYDEVGTSWSE